MSSDLLRRLSELAKAQHGLGVLLAGLGEVLKRRHLGDLLGCLRDTLFL